MSTLHSVPHSKCHWVIQNRILQGAYPRIEDVEKIVNCGIDIFVNLCMEEGIDYGKFKIETINFPIQNGKVASDRKTRDLINLLLKKYKEGKSFYIHCHGGIGRAGTICSILYGTIRGYDAIKTIKKMEEKRLARPDQSRNFIPMPESNLQVKQIGRILGIRGVNSLPDRSDKSWLKKVRKMRTERIKTE